jgi:hypothetical protein
MTKTATEAIAELRALIALDGAYFPCLARCEHEVCELGQRVLEILDDVQ